MVKDKVITHAIRQAYSEYLSNEKYPAFVLFIDLNPNEVDVNVHPTKHEVRFHQARLIHDLLSGMTNALTSEQTNIPIQVNNPIQPKLPNLKVFGTWPRITKGNRATAGKNIFAQQPKDYDKKSSQFKPHFTGKLQRSNAKESSAKAYAELLATHEEKTITSSTLPHQFTHNATHISEQKNVLHALMH